MRPNITRPNATRPSIEQMTTYRAVIECGSFAEAARQLGLSRSVVSRRIDGLETVLGTRLINRSTHFLSPTEAGTNFHNHVVRILETIDAAIDDVSPGEAAISGNMRIATSSAFGTRYVMPAIRDLMAQHPGLDLNLTLQDDAIAPLKSGADFSICLGHLENSDFIARYLKPVEQSLVCSQTYAQEHGAPQAIDDFAAHSCLVFGDTKRARWSFQAAQENAGTSDADIAGCIRLHSNDPEVIRNAAEGGLGIALLPDFIVANAVATQRLIRLLPELRPQPLGLYAVFPPNGRPTGQTRAVVDFLAARWKKPLPNLSTDQAQT